MNRNLIALAVSAALAAPAAIADVSVGGQVNLSYGNVEEGSSEAIELNNNASRITFKGSEELGNGLKANFFMEWGTNPDSGGAGGDGLSRRNQWVGLSGDWGETRFGRHDTPLKWGQGKFDIFNDQAGDIKGIVQGEQRIDNVVAYISPNFNGLTGVISLSPGEDDASGRDGFADIISVVGAYSNGPLYASAAYNDYGDDLPPGSLENLARVIGYYKFGAAQIGGLYETGENNTSGGDKDVWGLNGKYGFGNNAVKVQYLSGETDAAVGSDIDDEQLSVGLDHSFSKRTRVYVEYTDYDSDVNTDDETFTGVGIFHKF